MKISTNTTITYNLIFFQNMALARFRDVLRNDTDEFCSISVLLTNSSRRSPRVVTFSVRNTKRKTKSITRILHNQQQFSIFTNILYHNILELIDLTGHPRYLIHFLRLAVVLHLRGQHPRELRIHCVRNSGGRLQAICGDEVALDCGQK